jgi:hypothetical protein
LHPEVQAIEVRVVKLGTRHNSRGFTCIILLEKQYLRVVGQNINNKIAPICWILIQAEALIKHEEYLVVLRVVYEQHVKIKLLYFFASWGAIIDRYFKRACCT